MKGGGRMATSKGKGWYGDSQGHAKAGRKGGLARGKRGKSENADAPREVLA